MWTFTISEFPMFGMNKGTSILFYSCHLQNKAEPVMVERETPSGCRAEASLPCGRGFSVFFKMSF